jgi:hypothetical protein
MAHVESSLGFYGGEMWSYEWIIKKFATPVNSSFAVGFAYILEVTQRTQRLHREHREHGAKEVAVPFLCVLCVFSVDSVYWLIIFTCFKTAQPVYLILDY